MRLTQEWPKSPRDVNLGFLASLRPQWARLGEGGCVACNRVRPQILACNQRNVLTDVGGGVILVVFDIGLLNVKRQLKLPEPFAVGGLDSFNIFSVRLQYN